MKNLNKPSKSNQKKVYRLKSAKIKDYEYTKTYYHLEDDVPVKSDFGNDNDMTVINICKHGKNSNTRRSFIFSEGYIGAERSYNDDGTKKKSVSRKNCFGIEYLIKYIENGEDCFDNFHVVFLSDKETSENQADLLAQVIKDLSLENIETTYMWCHSKSALSATRAFQKLREKGDSEVVLRKIKAILTGMPTKGLDSVNRPKMIHKLDNNILVNILPFSGFIKTLILKAYDTYLYKPTPAQVDLKKPYVSNEQGLQKEANTIRKFWDKIWGNETFRKQILNEKSVNYDEGYLGRVTSSENMNMINDINYKILPVNINFKDALNSLIKHAQIMPFVLLAKKITTTKEKGDGITTIEDQGIDDPRFKFKKDIVVGASHDIPTTPEALKTIKDELLEPEKRNFDKTK